MFESLRKKLLFSSDPHQVTLLWHIFWHAIWHSHFIWYMFCNSFWRSIWYIFGDSLWLRSGGQNSDDKIRCWCCCCCCCCCRCCPCSFLLSPVVAENRQIGGVFTFVCSSRGKKHRKYWCVLRLGSPKPRYLWCCLPLVTKTTVFTVFFGQCLAKTLVFNTLRNFQHVARSTFSMPKAQKHCKLQCFGSALRVRGGGGGGGPVLNSNRLNNQVTELASLPFTS